VNTQHQLGAGLNAAPALAAGNFFLDVTVVGPPVYLDAARNMRVEITDPEDVAAGLSPTGLPPAGPAEPGDNRNALIISNLGEQITIGGIDNFNSFYGKMTSRIGIESNQNNLQLAGTQDAVDQLENLRDGFVGVSLEEEMVSLIQYQRGFESSAKFLTTVDEMMNTLIDIKR
ncbi:MAG: flagellar hook-associated protein FlgK, partial [Desulfobulbaceae bacterium]